MTDSRGQKKSHLTLAAKSTRQNTCCTIVVNTIMLAFFGIYAFKNPDYNSSTGKSCYVTCVKGDCTASPFSVDDSSTDVGFEFFGIFLSGFILCCINLLYAALTVCYFMNASQKVLQMASCVLGLSGALTIAWMVYTSIIIFGEKGELCRENYATKSGKFIFVWLIITYCCLFILCCTICMLVCIIQSNKKKQSQTISLFCTEKAKIFIMSLKF